VEVEVEEEVDYNEVVSDDTELWLLKLPSQDQFDMKEMDGL